MSDFQQKAAAAAARLAGEASMNLTPEETMSRSLAQDRPTIDSAVKSYLSLISARSLANSLPEHGGDMEKCAMSSQDALACCRVLLKAINSYTFPLEKKESLERSVVAQLWNGLVASNQKPSKFLGRRSLKYAYNDLDLEFPDSVDPEQTKLFVKEFGDLMQYDTSSTEDFREKDNDGALLWDADGGQQELSKRRERRAERASQHKEQQNTPTIEELDDPDEPASQRPQKPTIEES